MERLILDAEKLDSSFTATRDANGDLAMSYSDIVDAIHIVQTEMGITGTTAEEARKTISGSVNMVKASWSNLITGLADENANFEQLVDNFLDSISTAGDNILPRVEIALQGVTKLISVGVNKIVPMIFTVLMSNLPTIITAGVNLLVALIKGIVKAIPQLVAMIPEIVEAIVEALMETMPELFQAGAALLVRIGDGIKSKISTLVTYGKAIISKLKEGIKASLSQLTTIGRQVVENIKNGIAEKWGELTQWFTEIWDKLFKNRKVNVDVNKNDNTGADSSNAIGLDFVPRNRYLAELHRGEAVLTATEADEWRRGKTAAAAFDPNVVVIRELLEEIIANGLSANVDGRRLYNAVRKENTTRTRATNYNALAMA